MLNSANKKNTSIQGRNQNNSPKTTMKGHSVVLIPVLTNVSKILDLCTEYTYKKYIHEMKVFLHWDNHVATQSWTIPISSSTAQCKKFICDTLRALHIPIPKYIKLVKTVANRHVYILLYTESSTISKSLEKQFPVSKDGYRAWKWRTYWHTYYPWEAVSYTHLTLPTTPYV